MARSRCGLSFSLRCAMRPAGSAARARPRSRKTLVASSTGSNVPCRCTNQLLEMIAAGTLHSRRVPAPWGLQLEPLRVRLQARLSGSTVITAATRCHDHGYGIVPRPLNASECTLT